MMMNDHEHHLLRHRSISDRIIDDGDIIHDEAENEVAMKTARKLDNVFLREYYEPLDHHESPPLWRTTNGDRVYGAQYYASDGSGQFEGWTDPPNVIKRPYETSPPGASPTPPPTNSGSGGDEPTPPPSTSAPTPQSSPAPTSADSDIPSTPPPTLATTPR